MKTHPRHSTERRIQFQRSPLREMGLTSPLPFGEEVKDIDDPKTVRPDMDTGTNSSSLVKCEGQGTKFSTESCLTKSRQIGRTQDALHAESPRRSERASNNRIPRCNANGRMSLPKTRTVSENVIPTGAGQRGSCHRNISR